MNLEVESFLKENNIDYILHKHKAVYTCEEAEMYCKNVGGLHCKNLFLKDKKIRHFFLVTMPAEKRADLKKIKELVSVKHITFGSPEELKEVLNLEPGSVSPLGLINDKENEVKFLVDSEVWESDVVSFHPNINTASLEVKKAEFHKLVEELGNKYEIIEL